MSKSQVVELHSEACRCRGYLWLVARPGAETPPSRCCRPGERIPQGAVRVPAFEWIGLGMPRSAERYRFVAWLDFSFA